MTVDVTARIIDTFRSWDDLKSMSSYIAVIECGNPTPPNPHFKIANATKSDSAIQTVFILKGTNNVSPTRLLTDRELCSGKRYLVFGYCNGEVCCAYEDYKVIPLKTYFSTDLLAGKTMDEQIRFLLQIRLDNLKREIQRNEEEKRRLEEGIRNH